MSNNKDNTSDPISEFNDEVKERINSYKDNNELVSAAENFNICSISSMYSYNFEWFGRPIIQYPQDVVAMQELIWRIKPDLIIETGIAHGGSIIFNASMLALLDYCDAVENRTVIDPSKPNRKILGLDIDIREHNKDAINQHPMSSRIEMIEGSSIDNEIVEQVKSIAGEFKKIMIFLDSNHTHSHVLAELEAYAGLVSQGSYCVVFDTIIENLPEDTYSDRPWGIGDNPMSAVNSFLSTHKEFEIDNEISNKLLISVAPGGYLKRI